MMKSEINKKRMSFDTSRKQTRWQCCKSWLFPRLKKGEKLAEAYIETKVEKEKGEVKKTKEETSEIAAKKKLERQKKKILDQKEMQEFYIVVSKIFADDGLPLEVKILMVAKLMEKNPKVFTRIDKARNVIKKLSLRKKVVDYSKRALPELKI